MKRLLFVVILLPLGAIAVALSVVNRQPVTVALDPFGLISGGWDVTVPLFVLLFAVLGVGVILGGVAAWLGQSKWRYAARLERANIARLRHEMERLRALSARTPLPPQYDRDAA